MEVAGVLDARAPDDTRSRTGRPTRGWPRKDASEIMDSTNSNGNSGGAEHECGRCHIFVARFEHQVVASTGVYHRECFEAWYFGRFGRRPSLLAGLNGRRHCYEVRSSSERGAGEHPAAARS
jgi:hypothetical protein